MAFCPKCGKKGIKGKFCEECTGKDVDLGFKDIEMTVCTICDKFKSEHKWIEYKELDRAIVKFVRSKIKNPNKVKLDIRLELPDLIENPGVKRDFAAEVTCGEEVFLIPGKIEFTLCEKCGKAGTEYLEGVLQLRSCGDEVADFVRKEVKLAFSQGVHINKERKQPNGIDMEITSKKFLRTIGKKLKTRFNGTLSENVKLFSRDKQKSKNIYRLNVLFRGHEYRMGEVVEVRGRKVKVKKLGKNPSGVDVETGKKVLIK